MTTSTTPPLTRRRLLRTMGLGAASALGPTMLVRRARARSETLTIAQWSHFVPSFDEWFQKFVKEWSERTGVRVAVDLIGVHDLRPRAATEIASQRGHDLFGLLWAPAGWEDHVLPLNDAVSECERTYGKLAPLVHQATYNPKTRKYFAFSDSWVANPLHYRTDWWGDVGVKPETWDQVRDGARRVRDKHGAPAGFGLSPELDSNMMLRGLLWSHGATEQDETGRVTINSRATVDAIKLVAAIARESMTREVFMWDPSSNNRALIWGKASVIQNPISALRSAEKQNPDVARKLAIAPPPAGPKARLAAASAVHSYVIWKFAENPEPAKRFLVDLVGAYNDAFLASEFYNLPSYPRSVANLKAKLGGDRQGRQAYLTLADADRWSVCPGHPGYATAAIEETLHTSVIPNMFARVAQGELRAEDSARQAETEMQRIFQRWAK